MSAFMLAAFVVDGEAASSCRHLLLNWLRQKVHVAEVDPPTVPDRWSG